MFKVKRIETGKIYTVLDTYCEPPFHFTYFLIWEGRWCWRPADKYELCGDPPQEPSQEELIARFLK